MRFVKGLQNCYFCLLSPRLCLLLSPFQTRNCGHV